MSLLEQFHQWLYENYRIGNGHMLTELEENAVVQLAFLREAGLPIDTDITNEVTV